MEASNTESDWFISDIYKSSQESFRPNSKHIFSSTQDELFSSLEKEQISSFKPKREHSITDTNRGVKKKVRFADDQDTPMPQSDTFDSDCHIPQFDMNATCPVDFLLDPDMSFDATDNSISPMSTNRNEVSPDSNDKSADFANSEFIPNGNVEFQFNGSNFIQNSNGQTGSDSNPDYTYIMREFIVKKENDVVSYTFQKSYLDNDMNSSLHQSLRVNNDVTNPIVLEQKQQLENRKTGRVNYAEKRMENLGGNSKNIHISETFGSKVETNFSNNSFYYDLPNFNPQSPNCSHNFSQPSNQYSPQEFDATDYQSSQHSEFGNPFSDNSDFITSSQHSFYNHHDDEFLPKEFPNISRLQGSFSSSPLSTYDSNNSKLQFFTPNSTTVLDPTSDTSYSSVNTSLEFTPIISKLDKQLSLDSESPYISSKISDIDYL